MKFVRVCNDKFRMNARMTVEFPNMAMTAKVPNATPQAITEKEVMFLGNGDVSLTAVVLFIVFVNLKLFIKFC